MRNSWILAAVVAAGALGAPARADDACVGGVCAIPGPQAAPERAMTSAVDAYLATSATDAALVGGAGQAGYDGGFWIRGGSFLLKINLTLQTRWEGFDWDDTSLEASPGGDLSGFSLPRATLKLSGDATCAIRYYTELEFGHAGSLDDNSQNDGNTSWLSYWNDFADVPNDAAFGVLREGWIEWQACPEAAFRMGLVKTATTRQLMTPPEMQQFVDISMSSAFGGATMPGYTDRNRDYGFMLHGAFGCDDQLQYLVAVTNGDGPVRRNVLDGGTSDGFAYSARLNWDIKGHLGYEEGALRSHECEWAASVGAWAHYYTDHQQENPFVKAGDRLAWGFDAAVAWGGLSFTGAFSGGSWESSQIGQDMDWTAWFVQVGYLFPGTAWEIAGRYGSHQVEYPTGSDLGDSTWGQDDWAVAVTYYIDGHSDKVTLDATFVTPNDGGGYVGDVYSGSSSADESDAVLVRLQWQLAL